DRGLPRGDREREADADAGDDRGLPRRDKALRPRLNRAARLVAKVGRMAEHPLRGGCLCGGVRFEVTEPLVSAGYCHCTRCQRRTGTAASASGRIAPGSLRILSGEELIRSFDPDDGFSKHFCSACGSALWSRSPHDPEVLAV